MRRKKSKKKLQKAAKNKFFNKPFKSLKNIDLQTNKPQQTNESLQKPNLTLDYEESQNKLFEEAMFGVIPLKKGSPLFIPKPLPSTYWPKLNIPDDIHYGVQKLEDLVSGRSEFDITQTDEYIEGHIKSLSHRVLVQLRNGRIPYQDHLDLHGFTLAQAEEKINHFILNSIKLGKNCLLIIHGRGLSSAGGVPILKKHLSLFLMRKPIRKHLLAFCSAKPVDGGLGASYVLLRR